MEVKYKSTKKEWERERENSLPMDWPESFRIDWEPLEDATKNGLHTSYICWCAEKEFSLWFNKVASIEEAGERWKGRHGREESSNGRLIMKGGLWETIDSHGSFQIAELSADISGRLKAAAANGKLKSCQTLLHWKRFKPHCDSIGGELCMESFCWYTANWHDRAQLIKARNFVIITISVGCQRWFMSAIITSSTISLTFCRVCPVTSEHYCPLMTSGSQNTQFVDANVPENHWQTPSAGGRELA